MNNDSDEIKSCDYCHKPVSIYESLTEYGKHYHESCYIHRTTRELEKYRKKFLNGKLTRADKLDILDKFELLERLKSERTVFKGFVTVEERSSNTRSTQKVMVYKDRDGLIPVLDEQGNPVFKEVDNNKTQTAIIRPSVTRQKIPVASKQLSAKDIPRLLESLH